MNDLKTILTHKRKLTSYANQHLSVGEIDNIILNLGEIRTEILERIRIEEEKELAFEREVNKVKELLLESDISESQLIQHLVKSLPK